MKKFWKKYKIAVIAVFVLIGLIIAARIAMNRFAARAEALLGEMGTETVQVERRNLVDVIPVTGTIVSAESKTVAPEVTGAEILNITVEPGDYVNEGDLVAELDTTELEKSLAKARKSLENGEKSANITVNSASRNLNDTKTSGDISLSRLDKKVTDARKDIEDYKAMQEQAGDWYNEAVKKAGEIQAEMAALQEQIAKVTKEMSGADVSGSDWLNLQSKLTKLNTSLATKQGALTEMQAAASQHLANYNSYTAQIKALEDSLEGIEETREDTVRSNNSAIAAGNDSLSSAKISKESSTLTYEEQIESLEKQIAGCKVYAPISGTVTSVLAAKGDKYAGTGLLTIENTTDYEVSTQVDEYDIGKIKVGQRVSVKTNGTGDEVLEGVVKSIAFRATPGMSPVSYEVRVTICDKNEALRPDMTAKLSIVLSETENTLTVPYDGVIEDEENPGTYYVERILEDKSTEKVYVTMGISSDYYTEIFSEDLKEGDTIRIKREIADVMDFSSLLIEEGADGGM